MPYAITQNTPTSINITFNSTHFISLLLFLTLTIINFVFWKFCVAYRGDNRGMLFRVLTELSFFLNVYKQKIIEYKFNLIFTLKLALEKNEILFVRKNEFLLFWSNTSSGKN